MKLVPFRSKKFDLSFPRPLLPSTRTMSGYRGILPPSYDRNPAPPAAKKDDPAAATASAPAFRTIPAASAPPKRRLVMLASPDASQGDNCRTFIFKGESHTLGNALKNVILQNPAVTFCGYSIPHPAEDQMFIRIQTVEGALAQDVLRKGLEDLKGMVGVTREKFSSEMKAFKK